MKNNQLVILMILLMCSMITNAQIVNIPDPVFEQLLIDMEVDSDGEVNGQIAQNDALAITSLTIAPDVTDNYINDLSGIEAFTNIESLIVHNTMIEELNVSTLVNLKYLDCQDNMLTHLDLSNNPLLEYLNITSGGDVLPFNTFTAIDLSNNPNISELYALGGIMYINLKNSNNNENTYINIGANFIFGPPPGYEPVHTCIEVDNGDAAMANLSPYNEWVIHHSYQTYELTEICTAGTKNFSGLSFSVYPNPAKGKINILGSDGSLPDEAYIYDLNGRLIKEYLKLNTDSMLLDDLNEGVYLIKLVLGNQAQTKKFIITK